MKRLSRERLLRLTLPFFIALYLALAALSVYVLAIDAAWRASSRRAAGACPP